MTTRKYECIRIFNDQGEKVKNQSYWLQGAEKWKYFHDEEGEHEARQYCYEAILHSDGYDFHLSSLPEDYSARVVTEEE